MSILVNIAKNIKDMIKLRYFALFTSSSAEHIVKNSDSVVDDTFDDESAPNFSTICSM